ncbi:hypothetical protein [Cupriavidus oxalaticus]|uniref:hypothetical protein n=1 Tax=Cupriavidus oxalaticus TaxID=96344 RepID=UPI0012472581|nr:hypothetical protein [Cupriavidus oxalaticus]
MKNINHINFHIFFAIILIINTQLTIAGTPPRRPAIYGGTGTETYSFKLPPGWTTKKTNNNECFEIYESRKVPPKEPEISLCFKMGNASSVAERHGFFKLDGQWVKGGSMDTGTASICETESQLTISGEASCGIDDAAGFHAAGGICRAVIVFGQTYSVTVDMITNRFGKPVPIRKDEALRKIVDSIRLSSPGSREGIKESLRSHD